MYNDTINDNDTMNISFDMLWTWRKYFLSNRVFNRFYISDKCKFVYFTTLKTGSWTQRKMIDTKQCGFGIRHSIISNEKYWKSCGDHLCNDTDFIKMSSNSNYSKLLFTRHPIHRFESNYNFFISKIMSDRYAQNHLHNNKTLAFIQFVNKYYNTIMGTNFRTCFSHSIGVNIMQHLQPITLFHCFKVNQSIKCFQPTFVGKVETLMDDIKWIDENLNNIAVPIEIYSSTHKTKEKINFVDWMIDKDIGYDDRDTLIKLCQLYWNDFVCGKYQLPIQCIEENDKYWHYPTFCVDLNAQITKWPMHDNNSFL